MSAEMSTIGVAAFVAVAWDKAASKARLMPIAPHEACAKGGVFHLFTAWSGVSRAEAGTGAHISRPASKTEPLSILGGCGGKRSRDPNTHRCRGPADFSH